MQAASTACRVEQGHEKHHARLGSGTAPSDAYSVPPWRHRAHDSAGGGHVLRKCAVNLANALYRQFPNKFAPSRFANSAECTASRFAKLVIANYRSLHGANRRSRNPPCAERVRQRSMLELSMSLHLLNGRVVASRLCVLTHATRRHGPCVTARRLVAILAASCFRSSTAHLAKGRHIQSAAIMKRSRAKSRDDVMALMHVTYIGEDAVPPQQGTEM